MEYEKNWKKLMTTFDGVVVHLTMYGEKLGEVVGHIPREKDLLIVVGIRIQKG